MAGELEQVSGLLHEVSETHHRVFLIVDGADDDWASLGDVLRTPDPAPFPAIRQLIILD